MTLRRQVFLPIVLLFLGVGCAGSAIACWLESEAARRGFDDQARGAVAAVAELIEPADVGALRAGYPVERTRLGAVRGRLEHWQVVKRLFLFDRASGRKLLDTDPDAPLPADAATLEGDSERFLAPRVAGGTVLQGLVAPAAGGKAVVGIEISADAYRAERRAVLADLVRDIVLAGVAGLIVAAVLSRLVGQPIRRLGAAVEKIGTPTFPEAGAASVVREASDLGNTLGVMHSVLGETVGKARLALLESDFYRSDTSLAAAHRRELQPPAHWAGAGSGAEAVWLPVGSGASLAGAFALGPGAGAAYAGIGGAGGDLEAAVRTRAAGAYFADLAARKPLAEAAAETQALFGLRQWTAARWQDGALELWPGPAPAAWKPDATLPLACLGPVNRERLELYLAAYATHFGERVLAELPTLLDASEPGVILLLRRRAGKP